MQMAKQLSKSSQSADKRKKLKKGLIGVGVTGISFLLGWMAWKRFGPKKAETNYEKLESYPELPQSSGGASSSYRPDTNFPLSIYTKGEKVKIIQKALNARFNAGLKIDGYWGPTTEAALKNNGQPNIISSDQYKILLDAVTKLGLNGPQTIPFLQRY
jgi:peptidoglycan hydrolase-like protein with peptidoglycan-binding domain